MNSIFILLTILFAFNSYASEGKVTFLDWSDGDPSDDAYPNGTLILSGEAAEDLWDVMEDARVQPEAPNLSKLRPQDLSPAKLESRIGENYLCRKVPELTSDGNSLKKAGGALVYTFQCEINIPDIAKGKIAKNP